MHLASVEILMLHEPLQICMIVPDFKFLLSFFEVVVSNLKRPDYAQYLFVSGQVVSFL